MRLSDVSQGYKRVHGPSPHPHAVQWWYFWTDDGFAFARGGTVATTRKAREKIRDCNHERAKAHERWRNRPTHRLTKSGDLAPL
jgi:hypothetical protein